VLLMLTMRYLFQAVSMGLWSRWTARSLRRRTPRFQALRGSLLLVTSVVSFIGLQLMPVPEFTAIFMLTPLLVTMLAATVLHEPVSRLRWALVCGGFAGALIVIRPAAPLRLGRAAAAGRHLRVCLLPGSHAPAGGAGRSADHAFLDRLRRHRGDAAAAAGRPGRLARRRGRGAARATGAAVADRRLGHRRPT